MLYATSDHLYITLFQQGLHGFFNSLLVQAVQTIFDLSALLEPGGYAWRNTKRFSNQDGQFIAGRRFESWVVLHQKVSQRHRCLTCLGQMESQLLQCSGYNKLGHVDGENSIGTLVIMDRF